MPDDGTGTLGFWSYPGGGSAKKKISLSLAYGATVSLARDSSELKRIALKMNFALNTLRSAQGFQ